MPRAHPQLRAFLRAHHGVVSHAQLRRLGLTPGQIRALLGSGELAPVHEGVYRHAVVPWSFEARCVAISAADPGLAVTCGGAAVLWELRRSRWTGLHVICAGATKPIIDGPTLHRTTLLPPEHVLHRDDGIRVVTPARAVLDLSRHLTERDIESVIEQGIDRRLFDVTELASTGSLLRARGRPGIARFFRVLGSRPVDETTAADSDPEIELRRALARLGVDLQTQVEVDIGAATPIHPDLGDPTAGFYVEIDDHEWHGTRQAIARDRARDRAIRLRGGRIERVGTDEVRADVHAVAAAVALAYRQHVGARHAG